MINTIQSFLKILKRRFFTYCMYKSEIYLKSFKVNSICTYFIPNVSKIEHRYFRFSINSSLILFFSLSIFITLLPFIFLFLLLCSFFSTSFCLSLSLNYSLSPSLSLSSDVTLIYNLVSLYLSLSMAEVRSILWLYTVYCILYISFYLFHPQVDQREESDV